MDHSGKACVCFIATHGNTLELFDFTEEILDQVPPFINFGVDIERFRAPRVLGDDNFSAAFVEIFNDPIGVEGFVGDQSAEIQAFDQRFNPHSVEAMSRQQLEPHKIAQGIGESEDFRRHSAFRLAYGLALSPPFAP